MKTVPVPQMPELHPKPRPQCGCKFAIMQIQVINFSKNRKEKIMASCDPTNPEHSEFGKLVTDRSSTLPAITYRSSW